MPFFSSMLAAGYRARAVVFDGTNDWLSRTSALTGAALGKQGLVSVWFKLNGGDAARQSIFGISNVSTSVSRIGVQRETTNLLRIFGFNTAGTQRLNMASTASYVSGGGWKHLLAAWDLATPVARLFVSDADDEAAGSTETDDTLDYTNTNVSVGGSVNGSEKITMDLADLYVNLAATLDPSVEANRRKFISASLKPVDLGQDGSTPTGSQPLVFFSGDAAAWATNKGSGGAFTVNGALADAATSPSD